MTTTETKPKRKPGRPTTLTEPVVDRLVKRITAGNTVRAACRALRIHYGTVMNRRAVDAALRERLARAAVLGAEAALDEAEDRLRKATARTIMVVREVALHARWKAAKLLSAYKAEAPAADFPVQPAADAPLEVMRVARKLALTLNLSTLIDPGDVGALARALIALPVEDRERLASEIDRLKRDRAAFAMRLPAPAASAQVVDAQQAG